MLQEFKDFINKGDIVDLAVAVIMATAFKPIVDRLVDGVKPHAFLGGDRLNQLVAGIR